MPTLSKIAVYPLKSFDPIHVTEAHVLPNGALEHDRRFAFVDSSGKLVNAKRFATIHPLEVKLDPTSRTLCVRLKSDDKTSIFDIDSHRQELDRWFSDYFAMGVTLVESTVGGFPDDDEAPGPTIVSTSSLQLVTEWFAGMTLEEVRLRFRANLEIADVEQFWEDRLFNSKNSGDRLFRIGGVLFGGSNPCQRCVVPSRDSVTGKVWPEFAKKFSELRAASLPTWAARDRFDHFYRLTVNTRLVNPGNCILRTGDPVELIEPSA